MLIHEEHWISRACISGHKCHRRVTPSIKVAGTHLYTWVERGTVRVKRLAHDQEHNTMSPVRAWTQTAWSRVEHSNHKATAKSPQRERKGNTGGGTTWKKKDLQSEKRLVTGYLIKQLYSPSEIVFHHVNFARTIIVCRNYFANTRERFL